MTISSSSVVLIRAFFGTYAKACRQADELLFRAGDACAIAEACTLAPLGKLLPDDLYIHRDAVDRLGPLLRIYEGCGRAYLIARCAATAQYRY